MLRILAFVALLLTPATTALAAEPEGPAYGPELQGFDYPYPVQDFAFESQRLADADTAPEHRRAAAPKPAAKPASKPPPPKPSVAAKFPRPF